MAPMTFRESGLFKEVSNCLWLQGWTEAQGLPQLCHLHAVPTLGPGEVREELSLIFCLHVGLGVFLVVSWIPIKLKKLLQLSGLAGSIQGVGRDHV